MPRRRVARTRTTPTLGSAPPVTGGGTPATLPGDTGLRVVTFWATSLEVTNLDDGEREAVTGAVGDDRYSGSVPRAGGLVTVADGQVLFVPEVEPGGAAIPIDTGTAVLPSDIDDRVWVVDGEGDGFTDVFVRELDLTGRRTGETTEPARGRDPRRLRHRWTRPRQP